MWLLLVLSMAGFLIYTLTCQFQRYFSYPHTTKITVSQGSALHFPAVSICLKDPLDRQRLQTLPQPLLLEQFFSNKSSLNWSDPHVQRVMSNVTLQQVMATASFSPEEVITVADELSSTVSEENVTTEIWDTFWNGFPSRCYTIKRATSEQSEVLMKTFVDTLLLYLHVPQANILPLRDTAGINVIIHEPWEFPFGWKDNDVAFGTFATVTLTVTKYTFLPEPYNSMGGKDCVDLHSGDPRSKLQYFSRYTFFNCMWEHVSFGTDAVCNCTIVGDIGNPHLPHCSLMQLYDCYEKSMETLIAKALIENEPCHWECQLTRVDTKTTAVPFPSQRFVDYQAERGVMVNLTSADTVKLLVAYESDMVFTTRHVPALTLDDICSTIGGQMGLFLGASLLTITEWFQHGLILSCMVFKHLFCKERIISATGNN